MHPNTRRCRRYQRGYDKIRWPWPWLVGAERRCVVTPKITYVSVWNCFVFFFSFLGSVRLSACHCHSVCRCWFQNWSRNCVVVGVRGCLSLSCCSKWNILFQGYGFAGANGEEKSPLKDWKVRFGWMYVGIWWRVFFHSCLNSNVFKIIRFGSIARDIWISNKMRTSIRITFAPNLAMSLEDGRQGH